MVPPDSDRVPPAPPYSGTGSGSDTVSRTGLSPAAARLSRQVPLPCRSPLVAGPTTPRAPRRPRFGLVPFRSPLLGESLLVFLSSDYLDVSVRRVGNLIRLTRLQRAGFPHSDIRGSWAVRASPRLFAACRVLLRLREPRHPPCALWYLSRTAPVPPPSRQRDTRVSSLFFLLELVDCFLCLSFHPVKEPCPLAGPGFRHGAFADPVESKVAHWS